MSGSQIDLPVLADRFSTKRELLNHLYGHTGVELPFVAQLLAQSNFPMLTEVVCFILDRMTNEQYHLSLQPGTQFSDAFVIVFLGINLGYAQITPSSYPISQLFHEQPDGIDFFRILRSRTDWTGDEFRIAINSSPLIEFKKFVRGQLPSVSPPRRIFFHVAKAIELAFTNTEDNINLWFGTDVLDPQVSELSPEIVQELNLGNTSSLTELVKCIVGSTNVNALKALFSLDSPKIKTINDEYLKLILPDGEPCEVLPHSVRHSLCYFEAVNLNYFSSFLSRFETSRLKKELKNGDKIAQDKSNQKQVQKEEVLEENGDQVPSDQQKEPEEDINWEEKKLKMQTTLDGFEYMAKGHRAQFDFLLDQYGVSLCSIKDIVGMYICAKAYGDDDVVEKLSALAGINDDNYLCYTNDIREGLDHDIPSMRIGFDELNKDYTFEDVTIESIRPIQGDNNGGDGDNTDNEKKFEVKSYSKELISSLLVTFIRRNLIKGAQYIMSIYHDKKLPELIGDVNIISLTATSAVALPSTFQWLLKQKTKFCSNSKTPAGPSGNVFVTAFNSLCTINGPQMFKLAYEFTQRNPAFKPDIQPEELLGCISGHFRRTKWSENDDAALPSEMVTFCLENNLVKKTAWDSFTKKEQFIEMVLSYFEITDPQSLDPNSFSSQICLNNYHNEVFKLFKVLFSPQFCSRSVKSGSFSLLFRYAIYSKNIQLFEYLLQFLSIDEKYASFLFSTLSFSSGKTCDLRDLVILPSKYNIIENLYNNDKNDPSHPQNLLKKRQFCFLGRNWSKFASVEGETIDVDFVPLEKRFRDPSNPEVFKKIQGAANRAGIRTFDFSFFAEYEKKYTDFSICGGYGYDKDCIISANTLSELKAYDIDSEEYTRGKEFLLNVFQLNSNRAIPNRSPFLSMLELIIKHMGGGNIIDGITKFNELMATMIATFPISACNYLLYIIVREFLPPGALNHTVFQLFSNQGRFQHTNIKIWVDDLIFEALIETIGATDSQALYKAYDEYQSFRDNDSHTIEYLQSVKSCQNQEHDGGNNENDEANNQNNLVKLNTDAILSFQQYITVQKPFQFSKMTETCLCQTLFYLLSVLVESSLNAKMAQYEKYQQSVAIASKMKRPPPPAPTDDFPPQFQLGSTRIFAFLINQIGWFPLYVLRHIFVNLLFTSPDISSNFFDLYISNGGDIFLKGVKTHFPPIAYPLVSPSGQEPLSPLIMKYDIQDEEIEKSILNFIEAMQKFQQIEENKQANTQLDQSTGEEGEEESLLSSLTPFLIGFGAVLAAAAGGLFVWSLLDDDDDDDGDVGKIPIKEEEIVKG
jgi:hypothetical protein